MVLTYISVSKDTAGMANSIDPDETTVCFGSTVYTVCLDLFEYLGSLLYSTLNEPRHEKTCLRGFRPGKTQTGLRSHRS